MATDHSQLEFAPRCSRCPRAAVTRDGRSLCMSCLRLSIARDNPIEPRPRGKRNGVVGMVDRPLVGFSMVAVPSEDEVVIEREAELENHVREMEDAT